MLIKKKKGKKKMTKESNHNSKTMSEKEFIIVSQTYEP